MRVLLNELNRISSHLVCIATGGMEIGALTVMTIGFRERELVLDLFELITGLRMNHAFIRDRKSTRLNSSHANISYAVFCLKKKKQIDLHLYTSLIHPIRSLSRSYSHT